MSRLEHTLFVESFRILEACLELTGLQFEGLLSHVEPCEETGLSANVFLKLATADLPAVCIS